MMESFESGLKVIWDAMNDRVLSDSSRFKCLLFILHLYQNRTFREKLAGTDGRTCFAERLERAVQETVQADGTGQSGYLKEVFDAYKKKYFDGCQADPRVWDRFLEAVSSVPDEWYAEYYKEAFETILRRVAIGMGREYGEILQPENVTKLVTELLGYEGYGSVYNPYAGLASYVIEMNTLSDYHGEEINPETRALGMLRLAAHGISPESLVIADSHANCFDISRKYDYVVATPPHWPIKRDKEIIDPFRSFRYIDQDFLYQGSRMLTPEGKLAGVFALSIVYSEDPAVKELRRYLVDEHIVSTVILLPENLFFHTAIQSVAVVLDNSKRSNGIKFVDASSFYTKEMRRSVLDLQLMREALTCENGVHTRVIPYAEVKDYSLLPSRYTIEKEDIPEGYAAVSASDIFKGRIQSSIKNRQIAEGEIIRGRIMTIQSLPATPFADSLSASDLPEQDISDMAGYVSQSCVFINNFGPLRPIYVSVPEGMKLYYRRSLSAFKIDDSAVCVPLFLHEWARRANKLVTGGALVSVDFRAALKTEVFLPGTKPEQEALYERMRREYKEARAKELGLEEVIASQRRDFINTFRARKHNLGNLLGDVRNNVSVLSKFISAYGLKDKPVIPNATRTVSEHIEKLNSLLNGMYEQISHLLDEELFGDPEKIDLAEKLKKIPSDVNYTVEYSADLGSLPQHGRISLNPTAYVSINARNLDSVIENIIGNAVKHGFNGERGHKIGIDLSFDGTDQMYVVVFKNDGRPMPEGFDTVRYGIEGEKGVDSDGHGQGGAIVKGIVEHFGGRIEVVNDPNAMYPVEIIIKLPKYDGD